MNGVPANGSALDRAAMVLADLPRLSVTPDPAPVGATMLVTGSGHCFLYWQGHDGYFEVSLGFGDGVTVRAQGIRGNFTATVTAPISPGGYVLTSTCLYTRAEEGTSIAVTVIEPERPQSSVVAEPSTVALGGTILVTASPVPAACSEGTIELTFDSKGVGSTWTMFGGVPGGSTKFMVPPDTTAGTHRVGVTCTAPDGGVEALPSVDLTVTGAAGSTDSTGVQRPVKTSTEALSTTTSIPPTSSQPSTTRTFSSSARPTSSTARETTRTATTSQPAAVGAAGEPHDFDRPQKRAAVATWLRPPTDSGLMDPTHLATSAVLAVLLMLLIGFPAQLFEATYEENEKRIKVFLARHGFRRVPRPRRQSHVPAPVAIAGFAVLGAVLYGLTDPNFGRDGAQTLLDAAGFLVALPLVTLAFEVPAERYARRGGRVPARLRVLPAALVIALVCAVASFLGQFQPGYVYGLIAGYAVLTTSRMDRATSARAVLVGSAALAVVSLTAWLAWAPLDSALTTVGAPGAQRVVDAVLATVVVVGVQALAFQLLPLTFLDGHAVHEWSRTRWRVVYAFALFALIAVTFHPRTRNDTTDPQVLVMVALFALFGAGSVAFWAWFRYTPEPVPSSSGDIGA
ncbi:FGLLP motif-containing membrane protein [Terrabacter sp. GCM10028922]|uniref:FGLLP motif-containing membrane protein n=1 Tax=Terrabacter sp. GCM10028922 TaxID=3273428 RepID=UPI003610BC03